MLPVHPSLLRRGGKLGCMRTTGSGAGSQTRKVIPGVIKLSAHPSEGEDFFFLKKENKRYLGPNSMMLGAQPERITFSESAELGPLLGDVFFSFPGKLLLKHNSHWLFLKGLCSVCSAGF